MWEPKQEKSASLRRGGLKPRQPQSVWEGRSQTQPSHYILQLQQQYGNHYVQRVLGLGGKQAIRRACGRGDRVGSCSSEIKTEDLGHLTPPPAPGTVSGGRALHPLVRAQMEQGFGRDFGGVRVHEDVTGVPLPKNLGAEAFTIGQDVFVG